MEESTQPVVHRPRRRFGRAVAVAIITLLLLLGIWGWWRYYYTYSIGYRYGLLQKFSKRGNLFKTYEGELVLSSVRGNANVPIASEKFYFSVADEAVASQLMGKEGHTVTLHYKQKKAAIAWRGDTEYIVDSIVVEQ